MAKLGKVYLYYKSPFYVLFDSKLFIFHIDGQDGTGGAAGPGGVAGSPGAAGAAGSAGAGGTGKNQFNVLINSDKF